MELNLSSLPLISSKGGKQTYQFKTISHFSFKRGQFGIEPVLLSSSRGNLHFQGPWGGIPCGLCCVFWGIGLCPWCTCSTWPWSPLWLLGQRCCFLLVPTAKPLCLFSSCSLATSTSLWGELGNAGGFPHSTPGCTARRTDLRHSLSAVAGLLLRHRAVWGHPVSWATFWKADSILSSSQIFLCPSEMCSQGFDHDAVPFYPASLRVSAAGLHIRDPLKPQSHVLWFFSVSLADLPHLWT